MGSYASIILAFTPAGIPLVRELNKPKPIFWKLPGGGSHEDETPQECALRELEEETGLKAEGEDLKEISRQEKGDHTKFFFRVKVASLDGLKNHGDEGEEVGLFSSDSVLDMIRKMEFFPPHSKVTERQLLKR